jgi:hypothetical protein
MQTQKVRKIILKFHDMRNDWRYLEIWRLEETIPAKEMTIRVKGRCEYRISGQV